MYTNARSLVFSRMCAAFAVCLLAAAVADAAGTKDRVYQFGDDPFEGGSPGNPLAAGTFDSFAFDPISILDYQDFAVGAPATAPVYVDTDATGGTNRPGAAATEVGIGFDGIDDVIFIDGAPTTTVATGSGGLGIPSYSDWQTKYGSPSVVNWTGINQRYMEGWVRPTTAKTTRQDVVADTQQFTIFISPSNAAVNPSSWGMTHGDPNPTDAEMDVIVTSSDAVEFGQWAHVMQRSFEGDAVLYVNGIGVAHTTNNVDTTPTEAGDNYNMVFGAGMDKVSNFFAGQVDDWNFGVNGNNAATAASAGLPAGMNWGAVDMAVDNDFIKVTLAAAGNKLGDVNIDGSVNQTDVNIFVTNWQTRRTINGFQFGDLNSRDGGDFDFDGDVDLNDAIVLRNGLLIAGSGASFDLGSLVPEPTSVVLALFGLASVAGVRRRKS